LLSRYAGLPENQRLSMLSEGAVILSGVTDRVERDYYISWIAEKYCGGKGVNIEKVEQILISQVTGHRSDSRARVKKPVADSGAIETMTAQVSGLSPLAKLERHLLCALFAHPTLLVEQTDLLSANDFSEAIHQRLLEVMNGIVRNGGTPNGEQVVAASREDVVVSTLAAELMVTPMPWMEQSEVEKLVERLKNTHSARRRRELQTLVANQKGKEVPADVLAELHSLQRQKSQQVARREVGE